MKIRGWSIDGFGAFRHYDVRGLPDGLTIVHGPNEAGKSTLLWFLRGMLFGFPDRRRNAPAYVPHDGGRHGGRLLLSGPGGEYVIDRQASAPRSCHITGPTGAGLDESRLVELLGGADEHVFRTVFAFSLTELMSLQSLTTSGVRDRIFSAGVAGAGRSARMAIERLEETRQTLLRPRGQARVTGLMAELQGLQARLDESKKAAGRYVTCLDEERQARERLGRQAGRLENARREQGRVQQLIDLWPLRRDLLDARAALAEAEAVETFPERPRERLSAVRQDVERAQRALDDILAEQEDIARRRGELRIDDRARAVATDVGTLVAELALHRERLAQLPQIARRRAAAERGLEVTLRGLGDGWDVSRVRAAERPLPGRQEIREWERRLDRAAREVEACRGALSAAEARCAGCQQRVAEIRASFPAREPGASQVIGEQERIVRRLRSNVLEHRACLAEVKADAMAAQVRCDGRPRAHWVARALSSPFVYGLGLVGVLAVAMERGGGALEVLGWTALVAVVIALIRALGRRRGTMVAAQPDSSRAGGAPQELGALRAAIAADAGTLGFEADGVPSLAAIEARETGIINEKAARTAWDAIERELGAARDAAVTADRDAAERRAQADDAARVLSEMRCGWEKWKAEHDLPTALAPSDAFAFLESLVQARDHAAACDRSADDERRCAASIQAWEVRARGALHAAGSDPPGDIQGDDLIAALQRMAAECAHDAETRRAVDALAGEESKLSVRRRGAEKAHGAAVEARAALLAEAGVVSEQEFLRRLQAFEQREALSARIRERETEIATRLETTERPDELRAALEHGSVHEWRERQRVLAREVEEYEEARDAAVRAHRDAETECRRLEEAIEIATLESDREARIDEIRASVREWRVCTLARTLIERTLREFERSRQPRVLAQASSIFRAVTGGRYTRIVHTEDQELAVLGRDGRRHATTRLSRGTAEQLYLCIRLGLVEEFAQRSVSLPVIMDDVLVNFDPQRARAMGYELREFAARHQLLLFTCHPATRDLMLECAPGARVVELDARASAKGPATVGPPARREVVQELV